MTVEEKVKELLAKEYRMEYWDCYNDVLVEEIKKECSVERCHFYNEVEQKLLKMKEKI